MPRPTVFISSTASGFEDLREPLRYVLDQRGFDVLAFEEPAFPVSGDQQALQECLAIVRSADYHLLLTTRAASVRFTYSRSLVRRQGSRSVCRGDCRQRSAPTRSNVVGTRSRGLWLDSRLGPTGPRCRARDAQPDDGGAWRRHREPRPIAPVSPRGPQSGAHPGEWPSTIPSPHSRHGGAGVIPEPRPAIFSTAGWSIRLMTQTLTARHWGSFAPALEEMNRLSMLPGGASCRRFRLSAGACQ